MFSNITPIAFGSYPDATQFSKPNLSASLSNALLYLNDCCWRKAGPAINAPGLFVAIATAIEETSIKNIKYVKNSWFTFPITVKPNTKFTKKDLVNYLSKRKIANRPVIAGNIADQPFLKKFKFKKTELSNSKLIMN